MKIQALTALALLTSLSVACATEDPDRNDPKKLKAALLASLKAETVPAFLRFQTASRTLSEKSVIFCGELTTKSLAAVQDSFREWNLAWNAVRPYNFGPFANNVIAPRMNYFEYTRNAHGRDWSATVRASILENRDKEEPFKEITPNAKVLGLTAIEMLLFETTDTSTSTDADAVLSDFKTHVGKCEYLTYVTHKVHVLAAETYEAWVTKSDESSLSFLDRMMLDRLETGDAPIAKLLMAFSEDLDYVKRRKLQGTRDAQLSGGFCDNVSSTLNAMEHFFAAEGGLYARAIARDFPKNVSLTEAAFKKAKEAAGQKDCPNDALVAAIGSLEGFVKRTMPDGLGVQMPVVNLSDGD